ncbi:translation initiation factor if-2 [Anaeramoeba ignava]|uniref:Translation initiation factor if-2 n=1 Tax=Anaeramoeba ignava TaxID=1746090 RepID=A0A9Q0R983_ANAIG|nr:translation initiation factor if-2 [Anaeramoeba ignava]
MNSLDPSFLEAIDLFIDKKDTTEKKKSNTEQFEQKMNTKLNRKMNTKLNRNATATVNAKTNANSKLKANSKANSNANSNANSKLNANSNSNANSNANANFLLSPIEKLLINADYISDGTINVNANSCERSQCPCLPNLTTLSNLGYHHFLSHTSNIPALDNGDDISTSPINFTHNDAQCEVTLTTNPSEELSKSQKLTKIHNQHDNQSEFRCSICLTTESPKWFHSSNFSNPNIVGEWVCSDCKSSAKDLKRSTYNSSLNDTDFGIDNRRSLQRSNQQKNQKENEKLNKKVSPKKINEKVSPQKNNSKKRISPSPYSDQNAKMEDKNFKSKKKKLRKKTKKKKKKSTRVKQIFLGLRFHLKIYTGCQSGLEKNLIQTLQQLLSVHGGIVLDSLDERNADNVYIITNITLENAHRLEKIQLAELAKQAPVVNVGWIFDCIKSKAISDYSKFLVSETLSTLSTLETPNSLFDSLSFSFIGDLDWSTFWSSIIISSGGKVSSDNENLGDYLVEQNPVNFDHSDDVDPSQSPKVDNQTQIPHISLRPKIKRISVLRVLKALSLKTVEELDK